MKTLSYNVLNEINYEGYILKDAPERVLQFGEGNFLRAFVDYFIDVMNEKAGFNAKAVLCQPIPQGLSDLINSQEGLYTLYLRGFEEGRRVNNKRVISCVSRCIDPYADFQALLDCAGNGDLRFIVSNTTEAGIAFDPSCGFEDAPPTSFPGKLTRFLYERYLRMGEEPGKGFVILSCELIDNNGKELQKCVELYAELWNLPAEFSEWLKRENLFCSTLVDRIVTGYPRGEADSLCEENGYDDKLLDTGEIFGFWAIEGPDYLKEELPFAKAELPVIITDDHGPYKRRKVRILNGAHTCMSLGAYLAGKDIVRDCMEDEVIAGYMNGAIYDEIIPTLTLPKEELTAFARSVTDRFKNPFIDHDLLAISLNSTSKWRARVLPSLKAYVEKFGRIPKLLTASFAFYIAFYACRGDREYAVRDDEDILEFYAAHREDEPAELVDAVCRMIDFWGEDLSLIPGFASEATTFLKEIEERGAYEVMKACLNKEESKR